MSKEVVTLRADATVAEAARVLSENRIAAAPVVDDAGKLIGLLRDDDLIVSEANLHLPTTISILGAELVLPSSVAKFEHELRKAIGSTVGEVMAQDIETVSPSDSVATVATMMHESQFALVPVVEGGKLVGVVTRGDLVALLAN